MLFAPSLLVVALVGAVQAQTPSGFKPAAQKQLDVIYNSTSVKTPGELLSKAATANQPQIALPATVATTATSNATFMFVMMDLDVPPAANGSTRRVLLHSLNTGFKMTSQTVDGSAKLLATTSKGPATYLGPGPPATDTIPHRYVQLLFEQPATLKVTANDFADMNARIGFDINEFMTTEKLSAPLAGNFFTVDGKAAAGGTPTSGTTRPGAGGARPTGTGAGGMPKSTTQPFLGEAARSGKSFALAGLLGGLVVMAV
ncbi:PEBP-like protein [Pleomassaria siparia CBS 279.74]|uniref:PEBP-like protein n=1 Tax=Pleomassaria siparia CBS 279.74 TaxID=1314801 RepID=A0A6G1JR94_9PLEO|nr:PEBP-like protein [Pleomassaria siparia CBS 279.74]